MSYFSGGGGGRTRFGSPVLLHIYDLSPLNQPALDHVGCGIYHSGVEVAGVEYTFASGAGVFTDMPKQAQGAVYSHSVNLGEVRAGRDGCRSDSDTTTRYNN